MSPKLPPSAAPWEAAARGYAEYWLPRFAPFLAAATAAFEPGPGPLWVPGCGPGAEALRLARRFPDRTVFATDPAPSMLARLEVERASAGLLNLEASAGAADEVPAGVAPAGGILSTFTLQLLGDRSYALKAWGGALHPAGRIVVLFWPRQPDESAWGRLGEAMAAVTGEPREEWWEPALEAQLPKLGLELLLERDVVRAVAHPSPEIAFSRLVDGCSLRRLLDRHGHETVAEVGRIWLADHRLEATERGWVQRPTARLWVLGRAAEKEEAGS